MKDIKLRQAREFSHIKRYTILIKTILEGEGEGESKSWIAVQVGRCHQEMEELFVRV